MESRRINDRMKELATRICYEPGNLDHLKKAMCVDPLNNGNRSNKEYVNGALATLGDTVLKTVIADRLYHEGKDREEITEEKILLENNKTLHRVKTELGIFHYAYNSNYFYDDSPEENRIPNSSHDMYIEAIVGAIYLDRGFKYCKDWIDSFLLPLMEKHKEHDKS